jgi:hypothetical protein
MYFIIFSHIKYYSTAIKKFFNLYVRRYIIERTYYIGTFDELYSWYYFYSFYFYVLHKYCTFYFPLVFRFKKCFLQLDNKFYTYLLFEFKKDFGDINISTLL